MHEIYIALSLTENYYILFISEEELMEDWLSETFLIHSGITMQERFFIMLE